MRGRRGRPGLVGTMARTAVVAGTATAVAGSVSGHQQKKAAGAQQQAAAQQAAVANTAALDTQAQLADVQSQLAAVQASQPAAAPGDDLTTQLQKLADLKAAGILDDAEFAAAKAKLLNA